MALSYITYDQLFKDVMKMIPQIITLSPGAVYGTPRSGMIPATMIATELGLPLGMVSLKEGRWPSHMGGARLKRRRPGENLLLVDDSVHGGGAISRAHTALVNNGVSATTIRTACVYMSPRSMDKVDTYGKILPGPRVFQWNLFGVEATTAACFDMDGVLCQDPTVFDDDGPKYEAAIKNAIPKHLPLKVGHIVTNRIERWRPVTEAWLARHGVEFGQLHMQPFPTAVERRKKGNNPGFKAETYKRTKAPFFVESHDAIAKAIFRFSKRPVISLESNRVFQ